MVVANEDLLMEMQRVGALMRRSHHKKMHRGPAHPDGPYGVCPGGPRMPPHAGLYGGPGMPPHGHGGPHGHSGPHGGLHGHGCGPKGSGRHGQARILAALELKDGVSQKDLAFLLGIRPQSLTIALEKLEDEALIERRQDEDDKRTRRVFITEAGKQQAEAQAQARAQRADDVFAVLSDEEKDQLAGILSKLHTALTKGEPEKPEA